MGLNYQNKIGVDPQLSTSLSIVADGWLIPIYKTCKPSVANCLTSLDNSWHCLTRDLQLLNSFLIRPWPIVVKFSNWVLFKQTHLVSSPAAQLRELTRREEARQQQQSLCGESWAVWGDILASRWCNYLPAARPPCVVMTPEWNRHGSRHQSPAQDNFN